MLIQLDNGVPFGHPVDEKNFRMLFRNTSFPEVLSPEVVEPFGFGVYEFTAQPHPKRFTKVVEDSPIKGNDGIYRQAWKFISMTESEKKAVTDEKAAEVRNERNMKLYMCDWTQLPESEELNSKEFIKEWKDYRNQLRNITTQKGFPWNILWPEPPAN